MKCLEMISSAFMPFHVTDHIIVGILTDQQSKGSKNETIIHGKRAVAGKDHAGPSFLSVIRRIPVLHVLHCCRGAAAAVGSHSPGNVDSRSLGTLGM